MADGYIDHPLAKKLRTYSKEESTKRNQPSFAVFPKKVVNEIVNKRPRSSEELKDIPGLSVTKIEEFGEDIIKMVKGFED